MQRATTKHLQPPSSARTAWAHLCVAIVFAFALTPTHAAALYRHSYAALTLPNAEVFQTFLAKHCARTQIAKTTPGFRIYGFDCYVKQAAITHIVPDGEEAAARRIMTIMHGCAIVQSSGPNNGSMVIEGDDCRR